jgi:superfamily II DNA or RNA helicase
MEYRDYLFKKINVSGDFGFDPVFVPDYLFDFQKNLIEWSTRKGRGAIFADCGLGKSPMELVWAQNVIKKTNGRVLLLTPLAVGQQMERESEKFKIEAARSRDGKVHGNITITNYEQLHRFSPDDFMGVICDESSILKNFNGKYKHEINIFMRKVKYRLLATATAAPNDFIELGTSSEALGYLGYMDMLSKFFKNDQNNCATNRRGRFTEATKWRLKGHAHESFWRWVTSWARAVRFPSDLGFTDDGYILPELIENEHEIEVDGRVVDGVLPGFVLPANGLKEQRDERRSTIEDRCNRAAEIALSHDDYCVVWCNLNDEGDLLEKLIPGSVQVSGRDSDDAKEEKLVAFSRGEVKKLITKPKIGAWGLNWQHCNRIVFFPTHSYEQFYQAVRRCWRFGQKRQVIVDLVFTKGDENMMGNLKRKQNQAIEMFDKLVAEMNNSLSISHLKNYENKMEVPKWL